MQRTLYAALPQHGLSRLGAWAARLRAGALTTAFIRWFIRRYDVDMAAAAESDLRIYSSFNAFFTRALRNDARPVADDPAAILSPVDGVVSAAGPIEGDAIFQAKGIAYSAAALLGNAESAALYENGAFITLYLRPRDYHRVHTPLAGDLLHIRHIPGRLWPVRPWAVAQIPGLFTGNERLVLEFESSAGPYALIMVGGMETVVTGPVRRGRGEPARWNLEAAPRHFARSEEIGRFNFGSTVIVLFPAGKVTLDALLAPGVELRLGQTIGTAIR